jgi:hypothetical protein
MIFGLINEFFCLGYQQIFLFDWVLPQSYVGWNKEQENCLWISNLLPIHRREQNFLRWTFYLAICFIMLSLIAWKLGNAGENTPKIWKLRWIYYIETISKISWVCLNVSRVGWPRRWVQTTTLWLESKIFSIM